MDLCFPLLLSLFFFGDDVESLGNHDSLRSRDSCEGRVAAASSARMNGNVWLGVQVYQFLCASKPVPLQ